MDKILKFFIGSLSLAVYADGLDDARATLGSLKGQAAGQLGQVVQTLNTLSTDIGALKGQMAAEEKGSAEMRERITAARKELAAAESSVLAIKALPEMIEIPLKNSFKSSYELFDRLEKIAQIRSDLAKGVVADGSVLVREAQAAGQNVSVLQKMITALIEQAERLLNGLAQVRDAFVPKR